MRTLTKILKLGLVVSLLFVFGCYPKWTETDKGSFKLVTNQGGQTLGYSPTSGVKLLTIDRLAFKIGRASCRERV